MRIPRPAILGILALLLLGCGDDERRRPTSSLDDDPPVRVRDLRFLGFRDSSAVLTWTAPGDDGLMGAATRYDIRVGTAPLTPPTWAGSSEISPPMTPRGAGAAETLLVTLRPVNADLWVALNSVDDSGNWSGISNVVRLHPNDLRWWSGFSTAQICCGETYALALRDGGLVAGGRFRISAAGQETTVGLARWEGAGWDGTGGELEYAVRAFTIYRGQLIAGGSISQAGGKEARNIVVWDGAAWLPLGIGTDGDVHALTVYRDRLIAAGSFGAAGDSAASNIASWDGLTWRPLGSGLDGIGSAVTVFQDRLIAGGAFAHAGGRGANAVASWDGSSWQPLGAGIEEITVRALAVSGGALFAGGAPEQSEGGPGSVAVWDGLGWTLLPDSENLDVNAMADLHGNLLIGGRPTSYWRLNGMLLRWDGLTWQSFGTINGTVRVLLVDGPRLFVGGDFDRAGPWRAPLVARWDE